MKALSIILLTVCVGLLVGAALVDHQQLPEKVASHFGWNGMADGWMDRTSFTALMMAVGLGVPAFVICIMHAIRFFPAGSLNLPNPSYWREPDNHRKACDFLAVSSLWFGSAFLVWHLFFSRMIVSANQISPPHLDGGKVVLLTVPLLVFTFGWVAVLVMRFVRTGKA